MGQRPSGPELREWIRLRNELGEGDGDRARDLAGRWRRDWGRADGDAHRHRQPHRQGPTSSRSRTGRSGRWTCARSRCPRTTSGLMTYDPAFTQHRVVPLGDHLHRRRRRRCSSTAGSRSSSSASKSSYLEVAYLLIYGELPTEAQLERWVFDITHHTFVHEDIKQFLEGFRYDAHPMGMLLAERRRALDLLPGREADRRPGGALHGGDPADREGADAGRVRLPPQPWACPTCIRTTTSPTPRTSSR